ncbi:MAG: DNA-directed RNA polymerase subunit omega [Alphaproteobacteria bacterium]|nr:DNA-directed RNA polymerase subunit omega [Rickettsiales bacterium]
MKILTTKCDKSAKNRFELAIVVSYRAKLILASRSLIMSNNQKPVITALQEVKNGEIDSEMIYKNIIDSLANRGIDQGVDSVIKKKDNTALLPFKKESKEDKKSGILDNTAKEQGCFGSENIEVFD